MKSERPNLDKELDGKTFRSFYYLKEELTDFCRKNGLPATGGKIELDFVCTQKHRAFFEEKIGRNFSFYVAFQKWLKRNAGKTYGEAIAAYYRILDEKKKGKTTIGIIMN